MAIVASVVAFMGQGSTSGACDPAGLSAGPTFRGSLGDFRQPFVLGRYFFHGLPDLRGFHVDGFFA
jgi:hypothetical protein